MKPSPTYHPPKGEECETSVEHGLPLWAEPAVGYCSRRPRPSPMWGSHFVGAHAAGPSVGEQKPLVRPPCGAMPVPSRPTYLPYPCHCGPCLLAAEPCSTGMRLGVDYGGVIKKIQKQSRSTCNLENTLERIAQCQFKTKMNRRSGLWQIDLSKHPRNCSRFQPLRAVSSAGRSCECLCTLSGGDERNPIYPETQTPCIGTGFPWGWDGGTH